MHCWLCYGTLSRRFGESCRPSIKCTRLVPDIGHNPFEVEGILQYTRLISLPKTPATASFHNGSSQQCLAGSHNIIASLGLCQTYGRQPFTSRNSAVHGAVDKLIFWEELTFSISAVLWNKNCWYADASVSASLLPTEGFIDTEINGIQTLNASIYIHSNEIHSVAALIVYWCLGVSSTCFGP